MKCPSAVFLAVFLLGCGGSKAPECPSLDGANFDADSGWNDTSYCASPGELGCFPFHASSADSCGPFITMRTTATGAAEAGACEQLIRQLNCGTYSDGGETSLTFHAATPDRLTMDVFGTYKGVEVDTTFFFNPCKDNCQSAITLDTIAPDQQKICEIPRQGKPVCLFPDTAHPITFVRADASSMVLRTAGEEVALDRVADE